MASGSYETTADGRTINQWVALAFGVIYTIVGIAGFFVSNTWFAEEDDQLLGFQVNYLHDIVHLLIGIALIAAAKTYASARGANLAIGATYLLLGVLGPFINDTVLDVIALNTADNWLHVASGVLLLAVALFADKRTHDRV